jgi:soluble lytic murein transglycosylase-like protein
MQILGETARSIAKVRYDFLVELCDIEKNIDCGCRVLRYYLDKSGGNYLKALTRYNGSSVYAHEIQKRMDNKDYELYLGATIS